MIQRSFFAALIATAVFALTCCEARDSATAPAAESGAALSERTPVAIDGFGPIKIGMMVAEAERASGLSLNVAPSLPGEECAYGTIAVAQAPLKFMLIKGVIARIDVSSNLPLATAAGAHIGSSEANIMRLYPHVEVTPHKYEEGDYLTITDPAHPDFRFVFETDGKVVTRYRTGRMPEVEFVEGCG